MKSDPVRISAKIISAVFNPLLIPGYGTIVAMNWSFLQVIPIKIKIGVAAVVFILTAVIPFMLIYGLSALNLIKSPALSDRTDRAIPYGAALLLYIVTAFYLHFANAPAWMCGFMAGGSLALAVTLTVNRWWKISAHGAGTGGLTALAVVLTRIPGTYGPTAWLVIAAIMIAGLTCTSRLVLRCHTPAQIYAGFANGFFCVLLITLIIL